MRTDRARWGLGDAAVGYLVAFVASALSASMWEGATGHHRGLGIIAAALGGLWLGLLGAPVVASGLKGTRSLARDFGLLIEWRDVPIGLAVGFLCQVVLVPVLYLPVRVLDPSVGERLKKPAQDLIAVAHGRRLLVLAVLIVVGAPFVEELFFRGLLQRSLLRRLGPLPAVVISSTLFGLAHYEPLQLLALVAFGAVLGAMAHRTGRLGPGIMAHVAFNAVTVIVLARS